MTRFNLLAPVLFAALTLFTTLRAVGDPPAPKEVSYVVYSRGGPDKPWFNGSRYPKLATAIADVERLKKAGYEAFYRAEGPDGEPVPATYVVYSRGSPDKPWFNGTRFPKEADAVAEVERLKKAGSEAFYRAEGTDGNPAPPDPKAQTFRVYTRSSPTQPWAQVGTFKTRAEADERAAAVKKQGHEVFVH